MISAKYNLQKLSRLFLAIVICIIGIMYFVVKPIPEANVELFQKYSENEINEEELLEQGKNTQIHLATVIISTVLFGCINYCYFNLSERWILKKKLNIIKISFLALLKLICITCMIVVAYTSNYHYLDKEFSIIPVIKDVVFGPTLWFDLISTALWTAMLRFISKNNKNINTFTIEKIYAYSKRIFIVLIILIQMIILPTIKTNEYRENYRKIYDELNRPEAEKEYFIKYEGLDGNLYVEMACFYVIVFTILGIMFVYIKKKTNRGIENIARGRYKEKELIIYHNPWNVKVTPYTTAGILSASRSVELNSADRSSKYILVDEFFAMVDYRAIENNIIDTSKFKNIIYVFEYNTHSEQNCDQEYINKFLQLIENCHKNNKNFIIVNASKQVLEQNPITDIVKNKYGYAYFDSNIYWYDAIINVDREVDKRVSEIERSLAEANQNTFIKNTLSSTNESINNVEKFYKLLKVAEYIVQYEALYDIVTNKLYEKFNENDKFFKDPTLGYWDRFGKDDGTIYEDFKNNSRNILKELSIVTPNKVNIANIKELVTDIHNKSLGHGSISYYISKKYNKLLVEIVEILVKNFTKNNISIENLLFIDKDGNKVKLLVKEAEKEFIYSGMRFGAVEYFSFENGKMIRKYNGNAEKFKLNLGEEHIS